MSYDVLDNEELLRLALEAMNSGKDADAVVMLKTLVERDPRNGYGQYLLAAQHAQMGLVDRAEAGFRTALGAGLNLPTARFQLGQLLLVKGSGREAAEVLAPLAESGEPALAAYARALTAAAHDDAPTAVAWLREGLAQPQAIPALQADMQRLLGSLVTLAANEGAQQAGSVPPTAPPASLYLSNYKRQN